MTPSPASRPALPVTIHVLDWEQALAGLATGSSSAGQRDEAIARWTRRCWSDLNTALPMQQHVALAHPGNVEAPARVYMVSPQAEGWLHSPLHGQPGAPLWHAHSAAVLQDAARLAREQGFCAADCGILGMMGALAAIAGHTSTVPDAFARHRRHFPLLGAPRPAAFAPMPHTLLQPAHPHALYAVMGDADQAVRCMEMGVKLVQLRLKNPPPAELAAQIRRCAEAAVRHGALFVINDHWQAALRHARHHNSHGIHGVHLGQEDLQALSDAELDELQLSGLRLGVSTHSLWELSRALRTRPSLVACGPVHATTTKDMPWIPLGRANVAWWAQLVHGAAGPQHPPLPLVAIGGMDTARATTAAAAGADMVAVVSAIAGAADPAQAIQDLQQGIGQGHAQRQSCTPAPPWPHPTLRAGNPAAD